MLRRLCRAGKAKARVAITTVCYGLVAHMQCKMCVLLQVNINLVRSVLYIWTRCEKKWRI